MGVGTYRNLTVWHEARELTSWVYRLTAAFPTEERFCLVSQMRRAAISVMANIAEGQGRGTVRDFVHFLYMARGSAQEMTCYCDVSLDLGYMEVEQSKEIGSRYRGLSVGIYRCIQGLEGNSRERKP